ncbi:MAG: hypothetical protein N3E47_07885 [Candidatus Bathyarchaeota archaeon]|nr:hypothetical protein [Candidatus Bathyarchaeota archaeon]
MGSEVNLWSSCSILPACIVKKRIEDKIDMAIETLKLALSKEYIDINELLRLVASAETYIEIRRRLSEAAEKN